MLPEKFLDVVAKEGVVSIVSWANGEAHVANTWNSYLIITDDHRILVPAYGLIKTEKNVNINNRILLTIGSKEVQGFQSMGTGFRVEGTARYFKEGEEFTKMKKKCSFTTRVLEITVTSCKQTI